MKAFSTMTVSPAAVSDLLVSPFPRLAALIDARQAFYVVGANLKGAMGAALASFAREEDAERFATSQGGRLVRFEQIDLALLQPDPQSHPAEPHGSPAAH